MGAPKTFILPVAGTGGTTLIGSSDVGTLPPAALTSSTITIGGTSASLGGSASLDNILSLSGTGLMVRTAANTLTTRSLIAGTGITISNPDGVSGNITIASTASGSITIGGTSASLGGTATIDGVLGVAGTARGMLYQGTANTITVVGTTGTGSVVLSTTPVLTILANTNWTVSSGKSVGFGSGGFGCDAFTDFTVGDTVLAMHDGAAGVASLKNGSTQQKLRVWGTTTGSKYIEVTHNGTDGAITTSSGTLTLSSNSGGVTLPPVTAPASPASGFTIYVDSADSKLKVKSSGGTVTILANP